MTPPSLQPIKKVLCAGDGYEIGTAQGRAAAEKIRGCHSILRQLDAFQLLRPSWLPHALFVRIAERRASKLWHNNIANETPRIADRVRGIANGAAMRPSSLHLLNVLEPLLSDLREATVVPPLGGCSAVAIGTAASANSEPMIARNFDYLPLIQPFYMMRDTRPSDGLRSLDFTCAPLAGAVDGLNEAGLCITCNYAYAVDEPGNTNTISMAIAAALAQCKTTAEAGEFLACHPRWGGGLLMLADASGDIASLELSNSRAALRRPENEHGVLFHTNRYQTNSMREIELSASATYARGAPAALRGRVVHDSSETRNARFAELLTGATSMTIDDLSAVMADHGSEGAPSNGSICMHSAYWNTTATLQFFPQSRRIRVAFDSACSARFTEFTVAQ